MKSLIRIVVLLLFSMASLCSANPLVPQIKVWGEYSSKIRPDRAVLTLKITGKGHCAKSAEQLHQKFLDNTLQVLADFGISDKTTTLDGPYTDLDGSVSSVIHVPVSKLSTLPGLIQSFASRPGSKIEHLAWTHSQLSQLKTNALSMAAKDAKQKAHAMAQALGGRPGEALLITPVNVGDTKAGDGKPFIRIDKKIEVVFRLEPL